MCPIDRRPTEQKSKSDDVNCNATNSTVKTVSRHGWLHGYRIPSNLERLIKG